VPTITALPVAPTPLDQRGAGRAEDQRRHIAVDLSQIVEKVERSIVGPVQFVELQHNGVARQLERFCSFALSLMMPVTAVHR
jgi:hypothetical protein